MLGISVDSVFTLKRYKEEQGYNFPLLSDFNKEVSAAYDSLYENWILEMKGVSKRSAFIVDKEGIIQYAELVETKDAVPDFEAINKKLESLNWFILCTIRGQAGYGFAFSFLRNVRKSL